MSKTVKAFFSQPMHGLTDEEIKLERSYMLSEFRDYIIHELGFDDDVVIQDVNNNFDLKGPDGCGRLWYLGRSIQAMGTADYIVFHRDFDEANGCQVEYNAAWNYFKWRINTVGPLQLTNHISTIFTGNTSYDT